MAGFTIGTATASNSLVKRPAKALREKFAIRLILAWSAPELSSLTWDRAKLRYSPNYEPFLAPAGIVLVTKIFHECNYFQGNEGNLDPSHVSLSTSAKPMCPNVETPVKGSDGKLPLALYEVDVAPEIEAEETDYGVRIFSLGI